MYNRYYGNSGRYERMEEPAPRAASPLPPPEHHSPPPEPPREHHSPPPEPPREHHHSPPEPPREHHSPPPEPPREHHSPPPEPPREHHSPPPEPPRGHHHPPPPRREPPKKPNGPLGDLRGSLDGILARIDPGKLETEDFLILAILYLMYRESGESEYLIALGAYLFL